LAQHVSSASSKFYQFIVDTTNDEDSNSSIRNNMISGMRWVWIL
jgi:hypothetical protein